MHIFRNGFTSTHNFFILIKMIYMIQKTLNIRITIKDVYDSTSLFNLSNILNNCNRRRQNKNDIIFNINTVNSSDSIFLIHPIAGLTVPYMCLKKYLNNINALKKGLIPKESNLFFNSFAGRLRF